MSDIDGLDRPDRKQRHAMHFPPAIRDALPAATCWVCKTQDDLREAATRIAELERDFSEMRKERNRLEWQAERLKDSIAALEAERDAMAKRTLVLSGVIRQLRQQKEDKDA